MNSANRKTVIDRLSRKVLPFEQAGFSRSGNSRQASAARASASNSLLPATNSAIPLAILRDVGAEDVDGASAIFWNRGQKAAAVAVGGLLNPAYFSVDEKKGRYSSFHEHGLTPASEDYSNKQRLFTQLLQDSNSSGLIRFLRRRKAAVGANLQPHSSVQRKPLRLGLAHSKDRRPFEDSQRSKKQGILIRPEIVLCEVEGDARPASKQWPDPQPASSDRTKPSSRAGLQSTSHQSTAKPNGAAGIRFRLNNGWTGTPVRRVSAANSNGKSQPNALSKPNDHSLTVERSRSSLKSRAKGTSTVERDCPSPFQARKLQDKEEREEARNYRSNLQISLPHISPLKQRKAPGFGRLHRELVKEESNAPKTEVLSLRRAAAKKQAEVEADPPVRPSRFPCSEPEDYSPQADNAEELLGQPNPAEYLVQPYPQKRPYRERRNLIPRPPPASKQACTAAVLIEDQLTGWSRQAIHPLEFQDFEDLSFEDFGRD